MARFTDYELEEMFKNFIDETTEPVTIWGMEYSASTAIQELDPIAYRVAFSDWLASEECSDCDECLEDCTCEVSQ